MERFIKFLDRVINFYLYFVVMACFLSVVPYINPNYPLFNFIFKATGFYLFPPVGGIALSPTIIMIILVLCSQGLKKIYEKYFAKEELKILVLTPDEFIKKVQNDETFFKSENIITEKEDNRKENKDYDRDENT